MKKSINEITRLQNTIDGLEKLVLDSTLANDSFDSSEQKRTETEMRHIFAASAARAKLTMDERPAAAPERSSPKGKRQIPLAVRLREFAMMLHTRPDIEPRLQAVFESSSDFDDLEVNKIIADVGKLLSQQEGLPIKAKSKKSNS